MIAAYQQTPADPITSASILAALDRMIRYLTRTRQDALGSRRDAHQEAIASVLGACRRYPLKHTDRVELSLLNDVTNTLRPVVSLAAKAAAVEVPLDEAGERTTPPPSFRRIDLERAIKAKKITNEEMQMMTWKHLEGLSWEEIGGRLGTTPDSARMRAERIAQSLSRWANKKK